MIQGEEYEEEDRGEDEVVLAMNGRNCHFHHYATRRIEVVENLDDVSSAHNHQFETITTVVLLLLLGGIFEVGVGQGSIIIIIIMVAEEEVEAMQICNGISAAEDHVDNNNNEHIHLTKVSDRILLLWTIPFDVVITVVLQCHVEVLADLLHRNNNFRNNAEGYSVEIHYRPPREAIRVHHDLIIAAEAAVVEVQCNSVVEGGVGTVDECRH